jgi:hypothetical protein
MRFRSFTPRLSSWLLLGATCVLPGCGEDNPSAPADTTTTGPSTVAPVSPSETPTSPTAGPTVSPTPTTTAPVGPTGAPPPPPVDPTPTTTPTATAPATETVPTDPVTSGDDSSSGPVIEPVDVSWEQSGSTWSVTVGSNVLTVDASTGGRITGFSRGGTQVIVPASAVSGSNAGNENNYGSTLTLAPQADSGWPPPAHLDTAAYTASAEGAALTLVSRSGNVNGSPIQVTKVLTADAASESILVDYRIKNDGTTAVSWAPWQITRVPRNGITFFPTGSALSGRPAELTIATAGTYSFWKYNAADVDDNDWGDKVIADGSKGWLGHATDGVLFLMQFPDAAAAKAAPAEGEIAIYASRQDAYVEIEPQAEYTPIPAGDTLSWKVKWSLHSIPDTVEQAVGTSLGDFADQLATELGAP